MMVGRVEVRSERVGSTLVIVLDAPPVNALGRALRAALDAALAGGAAADVASLVIAAEGRTFPAGADIAELGQPVAEPALDTLCDRIEAMGKPVVAALHGTALGGGLELALACHGRVAAASARMGLPEVTLGIVPGAGGTQRLPRLLGAELALQIMLTGQPVTAEQAAGMGLVDKVVPDEALLSEALALARSLEGTPPRRLSEAVERLAEARGYMAAVVQARARAAKNPVPAAARIVDCVEAALLLPYRQGAGFERAAFEDLVGSPEARALRAAFQAERRAVKPPPGAVARPVRHVLVAGAVAGAGLAEAMLPAGLRVTLADSADDGLARALEGIAARGAGAVRDGRMTEAAREADWARLVPALTGTPGGPFDLIVMAGEFAGAGAVLPPLAASSPMAPVVTLGRIGPGQARAAGLIIGAGALAEVLTSAATDPGTTATVMALMQRLGRLPVPAQGRGLTAPCLASLGAAARHLAARHGGAAVGAVLKGWGLVIADLPDGGNGGAAPEGAIAARLLAAMANAGMRLLGEGAAQRPGDIDVALIHRLGWPRHVAGPMLWAAERGLLVVRADLKALAAEEPAIWTPAPLFDQMIREGLRLEALDSG